MTNETTLIMEMISNFGFPIILSVYLLFRFEKRMISLEESIEKLNIVDKIIEDRENN
ncbi:YvrJ family protein [Salipaludibacillus sp. HK11]|uniref:YvrJ family protein n=1 Tax=Salipaludibacillus sp. HK11 TaxID=3394320 RepID=UPI0039FC717B